MGKVLFFGLGSGFDKIIKKLDNNKMEILGYIDNKVIEFKGKKVIKPEEIASYDYDC